MSQAEIEMPEEGVFDPQMGSMVLRVVDDWIVSVTPMIYNDRVLLTHRRDYPYFVTAGWCFPKGGAAVIAALVWDPATQREPVGYLKVAADSRSLREGE